MAHKAIYSQKDVKVTSPRVEFFTDIGGTNGLYLNGSDIGTSSVTTLAAVGAAPNANGALIAAHTLTLEPADATRPGVLTAVAQNIGGAKTFKAAPILDTGVYGVSPSAPQYALINASGVLGSVAIPASRTTGTVTGVPTVDTGAVSTYQTRGVAATPGIVTWSKSAAVAGIPDIVHVTIPAIQLLTFTGSPTILYPVGVANVLPAGCRPGIAAHNFEVDLLNNTAAVAGGRLVIDPAGVISLNLLAGGTVTGSFGLRQDTTISFQIVAV